MRKSTIELEIRVMQKCIKYELVYHNKKRFGQTEIRNTLQSLGLRMSELSEPNGEKLLYRYIFKKCSITIYGRNLKAVCVSRIENKKWFGGSDTLYKR